MAGPLAALAWAGAVVGVTVATTLATVCVYATLLRLVNPDRLRRALSYVHVVLVLAVFGAPLFMTQMIEPLFDLAQERGGISAPSWLIAAPPAWFASLLALAAGEWSATYPVAALAAAGGIAVLLRYARSRLSLTYAENLAQAATASRPRVRPASAKLPARLRLPPELSVVATLVRGQFRDDMTFRLGVLGMLPATLLFLFMAVRDGPLPDPFVSLGFSAMRLWLLHFAAIAFPLSLLQTFFHSESSPASWIFFSTPTDRSSLVMNAGLCVTLFMIAPFTIVFLAIFAWSFEHLWHAGAHALVLGLIAHLAVQFMLLAAPRLPFSLPTKKGDRVITIVWMIVTGMTIGLFLPLTLGMAYSRTAFTIALIAALALAGALMPLVVRRAVRSRVEKLEFAG